MNTDWIHSNNGLRVMGHTLDPRPVWLWNEDGSRLVWRNLAAKLFCPGLRIKSVGFVPDPVPVKGQISRLVKLGSANRASVSRMRFRLGGKPVSATCSCIPLQSADDAKSLLVICSDAPDLSQYGGKAFELVANEQLFDPAQDYVIVSMDGTVAAAAVASGDQNELDRLLQCDSRALDRAATQSVALKSGASLKIIDMQNLPAPMMSVADKQDNTSPAVGDNMPAQTDTRIAGADKTAGFASASPDPAGRNNVDIHRTASIPVDSKQPLERPTTGGDKKTAKPDSHSAAASESSEYLFDRAAASNIESSGPASHPDFPAFAQAATPTQEGNDSDQIAADETTHPASAKLLGLVDRLYGVEMTPDDTSLLDDAMLRDNRILPETENGSVTSTHSEPDSAPAIPAREGGETAPCDDNTEAAGRGGDEASAAPDGDMPVAAETGKTEQDAAVGDGMSSRYNFEQLSRILHKRINNHAPESAPTHSMDRKQDDPVEAASDNPAPINAQQNKNAGPNALLALSDEALVLNKLPVGILIFRDNDILFANRAMAEMAGYESSSQLRDAGLETVLPSITTDSGGRDAVSRLVSKDGHDVAVSARLQSTRWYRQSAYMLTVREDERQSRDMVAKDSVRLQRELQKTAQLLGYGLIQLDRKGHVIDLDERGRQLFGPSADILRNRPILEYVSAGTRAAYLQIVSGTRGQGNVRVFAGAEHCDLQLVSFDEQDNGDIIYGFLSTTQFTSTRGGDQKGELGTILPIVSREVRRPLATISGFNNLMKDGAYGDINNDRYREYVGDIHKATRQIEQAIGEIDDLSRLRIGALKISPEKIDLGTLLNRCIHRIRAQANTQRVFVRSAIPETRYVIEADKQILTRTIMNLLASAVTLTPEGGNVVLSAVPGEWGDLMVRVRDMSEKRDVHQEQFIVFHESETGEDLSSGNLVRSGVGLPLTRALAIANEFDLTLDHTGDIGALMQLAIPATRVSIASA